MPSRVLVRTGFASTASLALALMVGSPALADDTPPQVGDPCPPVTTQLPVTLVCDANGFVALAPPPTVPPAPVVNDPATPADPNPADPPASSPADPGAGNPGGSPIDVPPVLSGVTGGSGDGTTTDPGSSADPGTGATPGAGGPPPTTPGSGKSLLATANNLDRAGAKKSLLTAATAANPASSGPSVLAGLGSNLSVTPFGGGRPLAATTPSPLVADLPAATAAISAVQAPLLAAGNEAASGGGLTLAGLSSKALPGLLVVLATALVAAVGAGNLRYWQDRLGVARH